VECVAYEPALRDGDEEVESVESLVAEDVSDQPAPGVNVWRFESLETCERNG